ncbi:hypothetical protein ACT2FY_00355 [Paraburkholderia fungorum]|uniref:hypothetical protein n=1 Tax=Paraburkholderia fungorum TaxID=134537 RepID=UPI00402B7246
MQKFKKGDEVREIGKTQVMIVKGDAGVATSSMSRGKVAASPGKIVCAWSNKPGRTIQKAFVESALELAPQQKAKEPEQV